MDPRATSVLQSSMISYRHELFTDNLLGIPILEQHGGNDDNVPVYQSRRMSQLVAQSGGSSKYVELPGKGHWFDGVMTTDPLKEFYTSLLRTNHNEPQLPSKFAYVVSSSGDFGSRGGIKVDQLRYPDQLGRIEVARDEAKLIWTIKTSNILRFHISTHQWNTVMPSTITIDCSKSFGIENKWFVRNEHGSWEVRTLLFRRTKLTILGIQ